MTKAVAMFVLLLFSLPVWSSEAATLTVTSPNGGGEPWQIGRLETIEWTSSGVTGNVRIKLRKGGALHTNITPPAGVPNTGRYQWTVPASVPPGTDYEIRVRDVNSDARDESDGNFTIGLGTVQLLVPFAVALKTIRVEEPNGGEQWFTGESRTIRWTSSGNIERVKISIVFTNRTGGETRHVLSFASPNDGVYEYRTRRMPTGERLRVRVETLDGNVSDESDREFSIIRPSINLTRPNASDDCFVFSEWFGIPVEWEREGIEEEVEIKLLKNNRLCATYRPLAGPTNMMISPNVLASAQGSVPSCITRSWNHIYRIRISGTGRNGSAVSSMSPEFCLMPEGETELQGGH